MLHRRMSLVAIVPLVVVLLALTAARRSGRSTRHRDASGKSVDSAGPGAPSDGMPRYLHGYLLSRVMAATGLLSPKI